MIAIGPVKSALSGRKPPALVRRFQISTRLSGKLVDRCQLGVGRHSRTEPFQGRPSRLAFTPCPRYPKRRTRNARHPRGFGTKEVSIRPTVRDASCFSIAIMPVCEERALSCALRYASRALSQPGLTPLNSRICLFRLRIVSFNRSNKRRRNVRSPGQGNSSTVLAAKSFDR
jgi:hypothetical protein